MERNSGVRSWIDEVCDMVARMGARVRRVVLVALLYLSSVVRYPVALVVSYVIS